MGVLTQARWVSYQQMGGLIMWIPAGVIFGVVGLALFAAWLSESERRVQLSQTETLGSAALGAK